MNTSKLLFNWLGLVIIFSLCLFLVGLGETIRYESFTLVEGNILNQSEMPVDIWNDYIEFKSTYIFTNEPFILFLNFIGLCFILYLFYQAWAFGRNNPPLQLTEIFTSFAIFFILIFYVFLSIFNYIVDLFVNQIIVQLFNDIYQNVYVYSLLIDYFGMFVLISYFILWLSNEIRYFDNFQRTQ